MSQPSDWLSSEVLLEVLRHHPEGLSEHRLLTWLHEREYIVIEADGFADMMKLFRTHFLLFHRLYHLADELHEQGIASLEIHALNIRLSAYQPGINAMAVNDPLRAYYLDLGHLSDTDEIELDAMLTGFWSQLGRPCDSIKRHKALELLELDNHATDIQIKKAWRRLAMRHHPDRGGDEEQIKALNEAVSFLLA